MALLCAMFIIQTVEYWWYLLQKVAVYTNTAQQHSCGVTYISAHNFESHSSSHFVVKFCTVCAVWRNWYEGWLNEKETGPTERHGRKANAKDVNSIGRVKSSVNSFNIIYSTTCCIWLLGGVLQLWSELSCCISLPSVGCTSCNQRCQYKWYKNSVVVPKTCSQNQLIIKSGLTTMMKSVKSHIFIYSS